MREAAKGGLNRKDWIVPSGPVLLLAFCAVAAFVGFAVRQADKAVPHSRSTSDDADWPSLSLNRPSDQTQLPFAGLEGNDLEGSRSCPIGFRKPLIGHAGFRCWNTPSAPRLPTIRAT
jgi:hypothetical protein